MRGCLRCTRVAVASLVFGGLIIARADPSQANGCDSAEPEGIGLAELESKHATELAQTESALLLKSARHFRDQGGDENLVASLLLLQRILDRESGDASKADALILASQIRAGLTGSLQHSSVYKCYELKALGEYKAAHGQGYSFAELWGSYYYLPQKFLEAHLAGLSRDAAIRVRFEVYRSVDPCDPFRFDNGCYGPLFSQLAQEAAGTLVYRGVMQFAFTANLNLAACPYASDRERELGEAAARKWAARLEQEFPDGMAVSAEKARLSELEKGTFERGSSSNLCRNFNDV